MGKIIMTVARDIYMNSKKPPADMGFSGYEWIGAEGGTVYKTENKSVQNRKGKKPKKPKNHLRMFSLSTLKIWKTS